MFSVTDFTEIHFRVFLFFRNKILARGKRIQGRPFIPHMDYCMTDTPSARAEKIYKH